MTEMSLSVVLVLLENTSPCNLDGVAENLQSGPKYLSGNEFSFDEAADGRISDNEAEQKTLEKKLCSKNVHITKMASLIKAHSSCSVYTFLFHPVRYKRCSLLV